MSDATKQDYLNDPLVISFLHLRRAIGVLGIALPIIMVAGVALLSDCKLFQPSISDYFYTKMNTAFVGILCAVGLFLFCYKGYDRVDKIVSRLACLFALGVAFFPTYGPDVAVGCNYLHRNSTNLSTTLHDVFASSFFLTLAYFSLFLFTKTSGEVTEEKRKRNRIYRICGYTIAISILLCFVYLVLLPGKLRQSLNHIRPIFILETLALWAFGISWLVKGEFILKDK